MIEPTEEMKAAFRDDSLDACDMGWCLDCLGVRLAAVLAIVERDYAVYRRGPVNPFEPSTEPCGGCGCDKAWHSDVGCTGDFTRCRCVEWVPS